MSMCGTAEGEEACCETRLLEETRGRGATDSKRSSRGSFSETMLLQRGHEDELKRCGFNGLQKIVGGLCVRSSLACTFVRSQPLIQLPKAETPELSYKPLQSVASKWPLGPVDVP